MFEREFSLYLYVGKKNPPPPPNKTGITVKALAEKIF